MPDSYKDKLYHAQQTLSAARKTTEGWEETAGLRLKAIVRGYKKMKAQAEYAAKIAVTMDEEMPRAPTTAVAPTQGNAEAMVKAMLEIGDWMVSYITVLTGEVNQFAQLADILATNADTTLGSITNPEHEAWDSSLSDEESAGEETEDEEEDEEEDPVRSSTRRERQSNATTPLSSPPRAK